MTGFFKKLMASGVALSLGLSSLGFAYVDGNYRHDQSYGYHDQSYGYNDGGCAAPSCGNASGSWCNNLCDNICIDLSLLYWKVGGDEFDYAIDKTIDRSSATVPTIVTDEHIHDLSFKLDPGFRLGVGFDLPHTGWDVKFNWTNFDTSAHHSTSVEPLTLGSTGSGRVFSNPFFNGFAGTVGAGDSVDIHGHEKIRLNWYDFEFGKWCCCNGLKFRPHIGIRGVDQHDKFSTLTQFNGAAFTFVDDQGITHTIAQNEGSWNNKFSGVGIRGGIDSQFQLCDGWSLVGRFAGAVVWGNSKNNYRYSEQDVGVVIESIDGRIHEKNHQCRSYLDLALGLRWDTCACGIPVFLEVDWEQHYLFAARKFIVDNRFADTLATGSNPGATSSWRKNGNVCLGGVTATLGVCF